MTGLPIWATILSSIGFPTIIVGGFVAWTKLQEIRAGRRTAAAQLQAQAKQKADELAATADSAERQRDFESYNATRASVEAHIRWDYMIMSRVSQSESLINELRVKLGMDPIAFPEVPAPPPLFPRPDGH